MTVSTHFIASHKNTIIKYETDLLTYPSKKEIRINFKNKCIIWKCNYKINTDSVEIIDKKNTYLKLFKKPDLVSLKMKLSIFYQIKI